MSLDGTAFVRAGVDALAANGGSTAFYVEPDSDLMASLDAAMTALLADAAE